MNFIRQKTINNAVLYHLFVHAQSSDDRLKPIDISARFSIEVSPKRVSLAIDQLLKGHYVSRYSSGSISIESAGYQWVEAELSNEDSEIFHYASFGDKWLNNQTLASGDIPAAGRMVTLDHNQASGIEKPTGELIKALEADNGLADEPGFRERILGQIKAGRELIRAGVFEAQLFYMSMIVGLKMLIEKYKEHAIGAAASKLLDIIYETIGSSLT